MKSENKKSGKVMGISLLAVALLVILDQITKYLAVIKLRGQEPFVLINGVFQLRYLENTSAAFSFDPVSLVHRIFHIAYFDANPGVFLACKMIFFVILTAAVLVFLVILYRRIPWNRHFLPLNLIILSLWAGAVGNLIDRIARHYVVDFFDFNLISFPIFNVADIYVTVAAIALIITVLFFYKEEDYDVLFPSDKKQNANGDVCDKA